VNSSAAEEDIEKEREEKIRKKAEIAKKLLEEKYKSYSMRNLRSERAAMKKERQPLTARGAPSGDISSLGATATASSGNSSTNKKRDGRSITLTDLQVVKRERDNEVLRSVGPLSPRGRNLTSPRTLSSPLSLSLSLLGSRAHLHPDACHVFPPCSVAPSGQQERLVVFLVVRVLFRRGIHATVRSPASRQCTRTLIAC
jgi:hypothetical protein